MNVFCSWLAKTQIMNVCGYVNFVYRLFTFSLMKMNLNFWCKCLRISWEWTAKGLYSISSSNYSILSKNVRLWPVTSRPVWSVRFLQALLGVLVLFWVVLFLVNSQRLLTHSKLTDLISSFTKWIRWTAVSICHAILMSFFSRLSRIQCHAFFTHA